MVFDVHFVILHFCGGALTFPHLLKKPMKKKYIAFFLALLLIIYNTLPVLFIKADTMPTNSQYEQIGAFALANLIQSGEATELDFSNTTVSGTDFLVDLGKGLFTGDFSDLAADGLTWLENTADAEVKSIRDSVHQLIYNLSPNFFNFWYSDIVGQNIEIIPHDTSHHLGEDLRKLFTSTSDPPPSPNPPQNYSWLQNNVLLYNKNIEFIQNDTIPFQYNSTNTAYLTYDRKTVSYFDKNGRMKHSSFSTTSYSYNLTVYNDILNIYLDTSTMQVRYVGAVPADRPLLNYGSDTYTGNTFYPCNLTWNGSVNGIRVNSVYHEDILPRYDFSGTSIDIFVNYVFAYFCNVNIFVDDVCWAYVGSTPTYPIVIPNTLTIWNDLPLNYQFPVGTYIDLTDLTTIIKNAIDNSDVVHWSDIKDTYVDINGNTAVAVTNIYRNDDDNLYIEQYPLITLPKFDKNELDVLSDYIEPINIVIENTVDVLPDDIITLLKVAIILVLFSCIIHRLLE